MIAQQQLCKPSNWQDFELLCKKLWGEIWNCEDTIQKNGRQGQKQCGVDVYGMPKGITGYYGIQCKGKDDYTHAQLTKNEIDCEISKALEFKPSLKRFIFATTSNKDSVIEEYIRCKNVENIQNGSFEIYVSFWEDIVDLLEEREKTYKWYVNNCQYVQTADVCVYLKDDSRCVHPCFARKHIKYVRRGSNNNNRLYSIGENGVLIPAIPRLNFPSVFGGPSEINYSWCDVSIIIENCGSIVLEDQKLELSFNPDEIEKVSNNFHIGIFDSESLKRMKIENQEVFEYNDDPYSLLIEPQKVLVEKDSQVFDFKILPYINTNEVNIKWKFLSRGFNKEGIIKLDVNPEYKDMEVTEETDLLGDIPEDRVEITYYIAME